MPALPWISRLESLAVRGMRLGLAAIDAVCERLGRPERSFPSVLVGGTNGKGSTAATLASLAQANGRRAGLYTSPHLVSVTERIRLGPDDVAGEALDGALEEVFREASRPPEVPLTYFEVATAAAFLLFRKAGVDLAILEVGLGGRFDATNVAPARLSIVTSIALDHTADLGGTLREIAVEKAGIFRKGFPALALAEDPDARAALSRAAAAAGASFHEAGRELRVRVTAVGLDGTAFDLETPERRLPLSTPLPGAHQAWNAALAVRGAELFPEGFGRLDTESIARGVAAVRWPGRGEQLLGPGGRPVLLDGCHNPDGARALSRLLVNAGLAGRCPLVFGAMGDKDVEGIAQALFPSVAEVVLVCAAPPRGASPDELFRRVGAFAPRVRMAPDAGAGIAALGAGSGDSSAPIIVAGSLYLVGEARAFLLSGPAQREAPRTARRIGGVAAGQTTGVRTLLTTTTAPFTKEAFELEEERLPVYASRSGRAERPRGPARPMPGDNRTEYVRDRDRIVHSRAFRRLKHKTQVFIPYEGDHFRTRLTHTIEVSQIARSAARSLGLNEDLTEAIALGHDLGHTPFGHSGERILDRLLRESHPLAGGFKHNYQGVRVVDRLEKRYDEPGLNLTHDVREGILKHTSWKRDFPFPLDFRDGLRFESGGTLEAQLVNWSDEIAQQTHDLEDGLPLAEEDEIEALEVSKAVRTLRPAVSDLASRRASLIRGMIAVLTADLVEGSRARIESWIDAEGIATPEDFRARRERLPGDLVSFTETGKRFYRALKDFVYRHVIHSFPVSRHDGHARRVVAGVFLAYRDNPRLLPDSVLLGLQEEIGVRFLREVPLRDVDAEIDERYRSRPEFFRAIADHIAGMTDSYCNAEYKELVTG